MVRGNNPPIVMTIAGFDPSGGAGVLADIKTITAFGCYGVAAITSITFQNTERVFGVRHQSTDALQKQLAPLFDDFDIAAIKTGMLPTKEIIEEVSSSIRSRSIGHLVVDPVLRSTSGFALVEESALRTLTAQLFPLATLVTPNTAEAEGITGIRIEDETSREAAAKEIKAMGPRAVLITGGDLPGEVATDLLLDADGATLFSAKRIRSKNTHGTGCTLASALACLLARGCSLRDAVPIAKEYLVRAISSGPDVGHGRAPLNHFEVDPR